MAVSRLLPKMALHRPTGQARVRLNGVDHYLGRFGTREAEQRYDAIMEAWLANGRRPLRQQRPCASVDDLAERYVAFASGHYVKGERATKTVHRIARAAELLYRSGLTDMLPNDFGPLDLKRFQAYLAGDPEKRWSRATANELVSTIVGMFRWGVSEQLVRPDVWQALKSVGPLAKGRVKLRESRKVDAVDRAVLRRTRRHLPPAVRAMVDIQLLTGMRPTEVVHLRGTDLHPTKDKRVLKYVVAPPGHKLDHIDDRVRVVYFGPRARRVLHPWLADAGDGYVFSPKRSQEIVNDRRRAQRKTKKWRSHDPELRRHRKGTEPRLGDRYTTDSYRRAIDRACGRAFGFDKEGRPKHRWAPNRLRHTAATVISDREAVHVAQAVLGHSDIATTMNYVKTRERQSITAALRHG